MKHYSLLASLLLTCGASAQEPSTPVETEGEVAATAAAGEASSEAPGGAPGGASGDVAATDIAAEEKPTFDSAAAKLQHDLEQSVAELAALREQIAEEKIPLSRQLSALEAELSQVRDEYQKTTRLLDSRTLDLSNLGSEIKSRRDENTYLANLLGEYIRNFESRLHIAELRRYEATLEAAKLAPENSNLEQREVFDIQSTLVGVSLDRLEDALGGSRFAGQAVVTSGLVSDGTFVLVGPCAVFSSADGQHVGSAEQRLGSLEPTQIPFATPEDSEAAVALASAGQGLFPVDPTLGNAHKVESTRNETFLEHVQKGGAVMVPIFAMAGIALLIALFKWVGLTLTRKPSRKKIQPLLDAVANQDVEAAEDAVASIRGPVGRMLAVGVKHLREPRELIEEAMYEVVLRTRLRVQRFLPFIAICAASAPLLGLLGTVTGIINTFKMITLFGSGDVKSLSGGISEALITTKFGLIVAIPSLLLHAFLSRKAKGVVDQMESVGVQFTNEVGRNPMSRSGTITPAAPPDPRLVREQVTEIVSDLLGRLADEDTDTNSRRLEPTSQG